MMMLWQLPLWLLFVAHLISPSTARLLAQAYGNTDTWLLYKQSGGIELWIASDQAAADATNASSTGYFVLAPEAVSLGAVVETSLQPSAAACAARCAGNDFADTFNYCARNVSERCVVSLLGMALKGWSCELRSNSDVRLGRGMFVASGSGAGIFTGAPIAASMVDVKGYVAYLGLSFAAGRYNFDCKITYKRGACMILGSPEDLAAACDADPRCVGFSAFPNGSSDLSEPMGYLLGDAAGASKTLDLVWASLNPASVLYVNASTLPPASPLAPSPVPPSPGEAVIEAASAPVGSAVIAQDAPAQPAPEAADHKALKGSRLAGVIIGAGVAAAALGALAGYVAFRRRAALAASPTGSPAKLKSLFGNELAAISSSLPSAGRSSPGKGQQEVCKSAGIDDASGSETPRAQTSSSSSEGTLEESPSRTVISRLFKTVESPQWEDCVISSSDIVFCTTRDGSRVKLGAGASGTVFKILLRGQVAAAKVLDIGGNEDQRENFIKEAAMLRAVRHPNIVNFMGVAVSGHEGMLLMEYMAGKDLRAALNANTRIADGSRLFGWYNRGKRVALEVALGLSYLHQYKPPIAHLDLKPENTLLTAPPGYTAKLGDVGFARFRNQTFISNLNGRIGTFHWCAPEMLMSNSCDERADIFSYGIVLWEICSGERPSRGQNAPLSVPEDCPQEVNDLYLSCVSPEPEDRPTAREIVDILTRLCAPQRPAAPKPPQEQQPAVQEGQQPALEAQAAGEDVKPSRESTPEAAVSSLPDQA